MIAVFSLLLVITLTILINRVATIALTHTGMSWQAARFQARSALSGVGFATRESESVVNHPVRRRIIMWLMLLGNAGIVSVISTLILSFIEPTHGFPWWYKFVMLFGGLIVLWLVANSAYFSRGIYRVVSWALHKYTKLDVTDYSGLLHLAGEYKVMELFVENHDWMSGRYLKELKLQNEGILVLALERKDGTFIGAPHGDIRVMANDLLVIYGRVGLLKRLDNRRQGLLGDIEHRESVAQRQRERAEQVCNDPAEPDETCEIQESDQDGPN